MNTTAGKVCAACGRRIKPGREREAEMAIDLTWYPVDGEFPADKESQGVFSLGADCYKRLVQASES